MATLNQLVDLIECGWTPNRIRQELKLKPYRLEQMLNSPRLRQMLSDNQHLSQVFGKYTACALAVRAVRTLQDVASNGHTNGETVRRAAGQIIRLAGSGGGAGAQLSEVFGAAGAEKLRARATQSHVADRRQL